MNQPIEVRDMRIVHVAFRNAYGEASRLVRAQPTPSAARVTFLADHVDFGVALLHGHHESEDTLLYPTLVERVPDQVAITEEVAGEHRDVARALDAVTSACAVWRAEPSRRTGEALADSLDELNAVLRPHLDDEEQKVVPLAAITLTQAEWNAIGQRSVGEIPKAKKAVAFGMVLEPLDKSDRAYMKQSLPAPVRMFYGLTIDRPWKKYAKTLRTGI